MAVNSTCARKPSRVDQSVIRLTPVFKGIPQVTDIQAVPGFPSHLAVITKNGDLYWGDLKNKKLSKGLHVDVLTRSEQGLLGLAFAEDFTHSGHFVTHHSTRVRGQDVSRITLWRRQGKTTLEGGEIKQVRVIMDVPQPYANHNAGQLAFGPGGFLFIALGDGGSGGDPLGHGQNKNTLLGSMLRIDIRGGGNGRAYAIPADNPLAKGGGAAEIWAWGLRNPWRFSFDSKGRLWVADVGQNDWEEISLLRKGGNHGWNIMEANHCFRPPRGCSTQGLVKPVYEYGHDQGSSITGGYVYEGDKIAPLKGHYLFADFISGKIWALQLDASDKFKQVKLLGEYGKNFSTFGRGADGEIYIADFSSGTIYQITAR